MSFGFCGCFKASTQVTDKDYPTQRRSIQKPRKELDLLDLNQRRAADMGLDSPENSFNTGRNTQQFDVSQIESPQSTGS